MPFCSKARAKNRSRQGLWAKKDDWLNCQLVGSGGLTSTWVDLLVQGDENDQRRVLALGKKTFLLRTADMLVLNACGTDVLHILTDMGERIKFQSWGVRGATCTNAGCWINRTAQLTARTGSLGRGVGWFRHPC